MLDDGANEGFWRFQIRDKYGRWVKMGGGVLFDTIHPNFGPIKGVGHFIGGAGPGIAKIRVKDNGRLPDGDYEIAAKDIQAVTAVLPKSAIPTPQEATKMIEEQHKPKQKSGVFNEYDKEYKADWTSYESVENTPLDALGFDPEQEITIYRGVPRGVKKINPGDWVTSDKQLAQDYAGDGTVLSLKVKAKHLYADPAGDPEEYTQEMIYHPDRGIDAPNALSHLGIDFQKATMDASGTRLPTPGAFTGKFQDIMKGAKDWKEVSERLHGQTVTYFDFETTGISDYDGQDIFNDPVQLGAVQVKDGKILKRFNVYINPESKLSGWSAANLKRDVVGEDGKRVIGADGKPESTLVTPEWLDQQMSQKQALEDFISFIGPEALLGGQNVPFDIEILKRMADKYHIKLDIAGTIDSKDLASLLPKYDPEKGIDGPKAPDRKTGEIKATSSLGPVANFLGFEPANWHSADGDAEDSYNLVSRIIDRAATEGNKDMSLLDFPLMKKRYEERMAEFKKVVSPSNPMTDAQKKALETMAESKLPDIAKAATYALNSGKTRGGIASILSGLHAKETELQKKLD